MTDDATEIVYKVVRVEDGRYLSALSDLPTFPADWVEEYRIGERWEPKHLGAPALCFDSFPRAREFACGYAEETCAVLSCRTDGTRPIDRVAHVRGESQDFSAFWAGDGMPSGTAPAPIGTVVCPALVPEEVVWRSGGPTEEAST